MTIKKHHQQGFSLLEILIAFTIFVSSLAIILNSVSTGLKQAATLDEYTQALMIADSQLARVGKEVTLEEKNLTGIAFEKYHWRTLISQYTDFEETQNTQNLLKAYKVDVSVEWQEGKDKRIVELNTLKLTAKR